MGMTDTHDEEQTQVQKGPPVTVDTSTPEAPNYQKGHKKYTGRGTPEDPFVVVWDDHDPEDPFNWSKGRRWLITLQVRGVDIVWRPISVNESCVHRAAACYWYMDCFIL